MGEDAWRWQSNNPSGYDDELISEIDITVE